MDEQLCPSSLWDVIAHPCPNYSNLSWSLQGKGAVGVKCISFSKVTPNLFDDRVAIDQPAPDIQLSCIDFAKPYDTAWCRHQMETFSALLAFCAGNSPVTGEFPA